jgi:isoquinoline 1-oxidoreductase alpha subunit
MRQQLRHRDSAASARILAPDFRAAHLSLLTGLGRRRRTVATGVIATRLRPGPTVSTLALEYDLPSSLIANSKEGPMAKLNINGKVHDVEVEDTTPLLWVIREQVGLTGTKYGCGVAQCGACSVHINGEVVRSCAYPVNAVKATDRIVTIEGLSPTSTHPVQKAWLALDVPQCGYCQSGQIMAAAALLAKTPHPTDAQIDEAMTNICRCGTYLRIRAGVHMAAASIRTAGATSATSNA